MAFVVIFCGSRLAACGSGHTGSPTSYHISGLRTRRTARAYVSFLELLCDVDARGWVLVLWRLQCGSRLVALRRRVALRDCFAVDDTAFTLVARGSWLVARGSWLVARGSWLVARGSWHAALTISYDWFVVPDVGVEIMAFLLVALSLRLCPSSHISYILSTSRSSVDIMAVDLVEKMAWLAAYGSCHVSLSMMLLVRVGTDEIAFISMAHGSRCAALASCCGRGRALIR